MLLGKYCKTIEQSGHTATMIEFFAQGSERNIAVNSHQLKNLSPRLHECLTSEI